MNEWMNGKKKIVELNRQTDVREKEWWELKSIEFNSHTRK